MKKSIYSMLISCLGFMTVTASAESQKAHVHGVATVTIAIEGNQIEMLIESPADGLVGFEHKASSNKEKQAVRQAEKLLKSPELLFSFNGASCKSEEMTVDLSKLIDDESHHHEDKHDHEDKHGHEDKHDHDDKHGHKDKHDHEDKHDHDDKHGHDHEGHSEKHKSEHSDISVTYLLSCDETANLESVSVNLFKLFPRIEKIKAMWITEKRQGAELLDRTKNEISLR